MDILFNPVVRFRGTIDETVGAAVKRSSSTLRGAGSIPALNKYLYGLQVVVPFLGICVCDFSMFVDAPTTQELFLEWEATYIL